MRYRLSEYNRMDYRMMCRSYTGTALLVLLLSHLGTSCFRNAPQASVYVCPGEGPRYGDYKCNHDQTHRVCARLVDNPTSCTALSWNADGRSFWQITGQQGWNWKDSVCGGPNPGDSWCICMWATANLIREVGCDNVHINCAATDVLWVMRSYSDGGWDLREAKACLQRKCNWLSGPICNYSARANKSCKCTIRVKLFDTSSQHMQAMLMLCNHTGCPRIIYPLFRQTI